MWARVVEFMLGCWLAISPFVFAHSPEKAWMWATDWIAASLVIAFALLSYWRPLRHIHLATAALACGLIAIGRFAAGGEVPPALQNDIVVGLLLLMFALVPNHASQPPEAWYSRPERAKTTGG
jgi:peptidoglycan/LPS O-acetylase OafA/YrhL